MQRVNERFAETVLPLIEPDDLIWVHDYHLIPLGQELRKRGVDEPDRLLPPHPVAADGDCCCRCRATARWSNRCSPTT